MGSMAEQKVVVTGGTGFIGSNLVKRLAEHETEVHVIARHDDLEHNAILRNAKGKITIHSCDLKERETLRTIIKAICPEIVFHLAGLVDLTRSFDVAHECVQSNIQGTLNLLHSVSETGCSSFVHTASCDVYKKGSVPFRETNEVDPLSPYSISKVAAENYCRFTHKNYGLPVVMLRLSVTYGPNQKLQRLIPYVISSCLKNDDIRVTSANQTRDFTYVDDMVDGIIRSGLSEHAIGEIINLGNEEEITIRSVIEKIIDLMSYSRKPHYGAIPQRVVEHERWFCDNTKAQQILRWRPNTDLETGLTRTIQWYRDNLQAGT